MLLDPSLLWTQHNVRPKAMKDFEASKQREAKIAIGAEKVQLLNTDAFKGIISLSPKCYGT